MPCGQNSTSKYNLIMNATTNLTTEDLSTEILRTLSFYDEMSLEMIFLDIDSDFVQLNQEFKTQDLLEELKKLESNKRVKKIKREGQYYWIKNFPKKPWYKRLFFIPFK